MTDGSNAVAAAPFEIWVGRTEKKNPQKKYNNNKRWKKNNNNNNKKELSFLKGSKNDRFFIHILS